MRFLIVLLLCLVSSIAVAAEQDYLDFIDFCNASFGAESDSLYYEHFGTTFSFANPDSQWSHVSENSAAFGFETSLPAKTKIAYGETSGSLADTTVAHEDHWYFNHLHRITGLTANTQYYYQFVARDELNNTISSTEASFTTDASGGVTYISSSDTFPYTLSGTNHYVLTSDIDADQRAFTITGSDVTLDLNGFTVTYDNIAPTLADPVVTASCGVDSVVWSAGVWDWNDTPGTSYGVYSVYGIGATILNGTIRQGSQGSAGSGEYNIGQNPICINSLNGTNPVEIAGMTIEYRGPAVSGILFRAGTGIENVHHNVVVDKGMTVGNRSAGNTAINGCSQDVGRIHHNLVKRTRHQGIMYCANPYANEIYTDGCATNSVSMCTLPNRTVRKNLLFGTGYHCLGIGWAHQFASDSLIIKENFVHMQGDTLLLRSCEYGYHSSVNGFRLTQYAGETYSYDGYEYYDNTIIVKGQNGTGTMRGVQFFSDPYVTNLDFHNNTVKTEVLDEDTSADAPCASFQGLSVRAATQDTVLYRNNDFISNKLHFQLGDNYGQGGNHHVKNCNVVKFGDRSDYYTVYTDSWNNSYSNLFIDCDESGGASLDTSNYFSTGATGDSDYAVGHSLYIIATTDGSTLMATGTEVVVDDATGQTFLGNVGANGLTRLELVEYDWDSPSGTSGATKTTHTGHELLASGYTVVVDAELFSIEDNEASPVTINFATGATGPTTITAPTNLEASTQHQGAE